MVDISNIKASHEMKNDFNFSSLLSEWEKSYIEKLKFKKRKFDFISGRLAGKKAVKDYLYSYPNLTNRKLRSHEIDIRKLEYGDPAVFINNYMEELLVSISHSGKYAVSIVSGERDYRGIGIDIEKIEKREESFLKLAFSNDEIIKLKSSYTEDRNKSQKTIDENITRFWSIKESIFKSLCLGLNMDLKEIKVIDSETGKTIIQMKGDLKKRFEQLSINKADIESFIFDGYVISVTRLN